MTESSSCFVILYDHGMSDTTSFHDYVKSTYHHVIQVTSHQLLGWTHTKDKLITGLGLLNYYQPSLNYWKAITIIISSTAIEM